MKKKIGSDQKGGKDNLITKRPLIASGQRRGTQKSALERRCQGSRKTPDSKGINKSGKCGFCSIRGKGESEKNATEEKEADDAKPPVERRHLWKGKPSNRKRGVLRTAEGSSLDALSRKKREG